MKFCLNPGFVFFIFLFVMALSCKDKSQEPAGCISVSKANDTISYTINTVNHELFIGASYEYLSFSGDSIILEVVPKNMMIDYNAFPIPVMRAVAPNENVKDYSLAHYPDIKQRKHFIRVFSMNFKDYRNSSLIALDFCDK